MHQSPWRLIVDAPQSAARNMAIDEAIAIAFSEGKAPATLRLYSWATPSFSIGAFQKLESDYIALLEAQEIDLVRRMTGGRGILHDDELTYSVVAGTAHALFSGGIQGTFQSIAGGLLNGLKAVGVEAAVHAPVRSGRPARKNRLCFDAVSVYEITARGKKLIGSAQRRWKNHFLQHGSLVLKKSNLGTPCSQGLPLNLVSEHQITLFELMNRDPRHDVLCQALKTGFENALSITFKAGGLSRDEENRVQECLQKKYGRRLWNVCRDQTAMP